jgi:DNA (cytosine-5)-methyltransferase 1
VVERTGASAFVLENVKALGVSPRWRPIREALKERARELGFSPRLFVLNASHYGVPQSRERMFLMGVREGVPERPPTTTEDEPPTVREALAKLPPFGQPGNDGIVKAKVIPAAFPVMRPTAFRGSLLFNGSGRPLLLDGTAKTIPASMGGNATPIIDQEELESGARPWVVDYHRRLQEGKPPLKRAPKRMRRITVQEAAALQTMDGWDLRGPQVSQLRQIGNAVPPLLAFHVAQALRAAIAESAELPEMSVAA